MNNPDLYAFDENVAGGTDVPLVGTDEAGRGPLAGPVMVAAVVLDRSKRLAGLNDSKKLSERRRELLYTQIIDTALAWRVVSIPAPQIDAMNILRASLHGMKQAIESIDIPWHLALIDGNAAVDGICSTRQQTVVKGDGKSASIAAASILAKVTRDRLMQEYDATYPVYEFSSHKGYGTVRHRRLIEEHGLCAIHRKSFCAHIGAQTVLPLS